MLCSSPCPRHLLYPPPLLSFPSFLHECSFLPSPSLPSSFFLHSNCHSCQKWSIVILFPPHPSPSVPVPITTSAFVRALVALLPWLIVVFIFVFSFPFPLHFRLSFNFGQQFHNVREEGGAANAHRQRTWKKRTNEEHGGPTKGLDDGQRAWVMDGGGRLKCINAHHQGGRWHL